MRRGPGPCAASQDKALVENAVKLMYRSVYVDLREWCSMTWSRSTWQSSNLLKSSMRANPDPAQESRRQLFDSVERDSLRPLPRPLSDETADDCHGPAQQLRHAEQAPLQCAGTICGQTRGDGIRHRYDRHLPRLYPWPRIIATIPRTNTLPSRPTICRDARGAARVTCRSFLSRAAVIDNIVVHYLRAVIEDKRYPELAFRSVPWHHEPGEKSTGRNALYPRAAATDARRYSINATWWTSRVRGGRGLSAGSRG